MVQGDEECDDGNAVDGDGCSAACIGGGQLLWEIEWDGPREYDTIYDVVVDADNRIHAIGMTSADPAYDFSLLTLESDGELASSSDLAPYQTAELELRDDGALVLGGRDGELDLPWVRTYDAEGGMSWELVDDTQPGMYFGDAVWLDDGGVATVGQNAEFAVVVNLISAAGELTSSEAVFDGEPLDLARDGDRLVIAGLEEGSYWLAGVDLPGTLAWSNTDTGAYRVAVTAAHEILGIRGEISRFAADGQLVETHPYDQDWWNPPAIAIDPSGDVWLAGDYFSQVTAFGECQVARLGPDLVQKWSHVVGTSTGCDAIALAPDGTVVVAGSGGSEGDRGYVARISP